MPRRGKKHLLDNLDKLSCDLAVAKAGVDQIKAILLNATADETKVLVCYNELAGLMQDFTEEVSAFLMESSIQLPTATTLTSSSSSPLTSESTSLVTSLVDNPTIPNDSNLGEILQRLENVEKFQAEATSSNAESLKAQSELQERVDSFMVRLDFFRKQQTTTKKKVTVMSKALFGGKQEEEVKMDLSTVCDKLEAIQKEVESNISAKSDERASDLENKNEHHIKSIQETVSRLTDESTSIKRELQSTKYDLIALQHCFQQNIDTATATERNVNRRMHRLETKTSDLVNLQKLLNCLHVRVQGKLELQAKVEELKDRMDNSGNLTSKDVVAFKARMTRIDGLMKRRTSMDKAYNITMNDGNGMQSDGRFVVPLNGRYAFILDIGQAGPGMLHMDATRNGVDITMDARANGDQDTSTAVGLEELKKGDVVRVRVYEVSGSAKIAFCVFSGYRIA